MTAVISFLISSISSLVPSKEKSKSISTLSLGRLKMVKLIDVPPLRTKYGESSSVLLIKSKTSINLSTFSKVSLLNPLSQAKDTI